jgi:predicted dehydrogenase
MRMPKAKPRSGDREALRIGLLGAGDRGSMYARWIISEPRLMRLTALADPDPARREALAGEAHIAPEARYAEWTELIEAQAGNLDGLIIATPDHIHLTQALAALDAGLSVLLEKPMLTSPQEIPSLLKSAEEAEKRGQSLTVCHVLRYTALFRRIKGLLDSGEIGKIRSIYYSENLATHHYVHSYVRGNWGNSDRSSPFILAKSSHDLDMITWLAGASPRSVFSTGGRSRFTAESAPPRAPDRCSDGCPHASACPFEAERTYLYGLPMKEALSRAPGLLGLAGRLMYRRPGIARMIPGLRNHHYWGHWPTSTISDNRSPESIREALRTGPYGRCVYRSDNNQAEHLEAVIEFEGGINAAFRVHGLSCREGRSLRIDGDGGSIHARFGAGSEIIVETTSASRKIRFSRDYIGHGDADRSLMEGWYGILSDGPRTGNAAESLISHAMAFAAEQSRQSGRRIDVRFQG